MPPNADPLILQFVAMYCQKYLANYGFSKLFLIGSRAYGTPRPNSDHDFIAVVSDTAPSEISTGGSLHTTIFSHIESTRRTAGLGAIDLLIARDSHFKAQAICPGSFAYSAVTKGYQVE